MIVGLISDVRTTNLKVVDCPLITTHTFAMENIYLLPHSNKNGVL